MNRIGYFEENGKLMVELQEVTPVSDESMQKLRQVNDKPAYLQIFFYSAFDESDLNCLYHVLAENGAIEITDEQIEQSVQEDLEKQPMGRWEIKCDFPTALDCARDLTETFMFHERMFTLQISDEPTEFMKTWLEKKQNKKEANN